MSYPDGIGNHFANQDAYESRYDSAEEQAHDDCLYHIANDPDEFISEWVNAENSPSEKFVIQWARFRRTSEAMAKDFAKGKHKMLEDALTALVEYETARLLEG